MKKMVLVFALAAIALTSVSAFAQIDPNYRNNIGIYLDEAATIDCAVLPVGAIDGYLVLSKLSANEVLGWECKLTANDGGGLYMMGVAPRGQAIDVGSRPGESIVGLASPLPAVNGSVVVADVSLLVANLNPGSIYVDEVYFSLLENGLPAYLNGAGDGIILHPALGGTSDAIFTVNGDCSPVSVENSSFGSIKSMFR